MSIGSGMKSPGAMPCMPTKAELPEKMQDCTFDEVRQAWDAYNQSEVAHSIQRLDWVLDNNIKLSQWEIDHVNKCIEKFNAKYNSPLAKALK